MIAWLVPILLKTGIPARFAKAAAWATIALAAVLLIWLCWTLLKGEIIDDYVAGESVKVEKKAREADAGAGEQRRADDAAIAETKEELTNAIENLPDSVPSARRVALGCERLRRQGTDTSGIPACN